MQDILVRLRESNANEGSHDLQCRCLDAAAEIEQLRAALNKCLDAMVTLPALAGSQYNDGVPWASLDREARALLSANK